MAETDGTKSDLWILYDLKSVVQKYRSGEEAVKVKDIFDYYKEAIDIAAEEKHKKPDDIFNEIMRPVKAALANNITSDITLRKIELPSGLEEMFDTLKVEALNNFISNFNKSQKEINDLTSQQPVATGTAKAVSAEQDDIVSRLKREAIAWVNSPRQNFSEGDKQKYAEIIENASVINVKRKGFKCEISINGLDVKPSFGMSGKIGTSISQTPKGTPSTYGNLTKEDVDELIPRTSLKLKTAAKAAADKEAGRLSQKEKQRADKLKKLTEDLPTLQSTVINTFKDMVESLDSRVLFEALTDDYKKGANLLNTIFPDKKKENGGLQDKLKEYVLESCMMDKNIWSLYKESKDKNKNDKRSFYDKEIDTQASLIGINDKVCDFMNKGQFDQDSVERKILEIAGDILPREIARDIFIKGVFDYGMSIHDKEFTPERFNKMNKVLETQGYRIGMRTFKAQKVCTEGAKPVSEAVLENMNGSDRYRELALLYYMGEHLSQNKDKIFD